MRNTNKKTFFLFYFHDGVPSTKSKVRKKNENENENEKNNS